MVARMMKRMKSRESLEHYCCLEVGQWEWEAGVVSAFIAKDTKNNDSTF